MTSTQWPSSPAPPAPPRRSATAHRRSRGHRIRLAATGFLAREVGGRSAVVTFWSIAAAATTTMVLRLLVGGAVGLSDQGDGTRLLCGLGLRQGNPYNTSTSAHLYLQWLDHVWWGEDCGVAGTGEAYHSSETLFAALATWLTHLLTGLDGLDLRVLGVLFSVLVGLLVGGISLLVPGRLGTKLGVALALTLVMADGAFAGWFVSAYSEPAAFVGLLLLVVAVLCFLRCDRVRWWHLLLLGAATVLTVTAKTQAASLVVPVVLVVLARPSWGGLVADRAAGLADRGLLAQLRGRGAAFVVSRWPALVLCAALLAGTVGYLGVQPDRFTVQNDYAAVFVEMLPNSPDPAGDLAALGLPASLLSSSGLPIDAPGSAAGRLDYAELSTHLGLGARLRVYAASPGRLEGVFERGVIGMSRLRPDYLTSYPAGAGAAPGALECRICVVTGLWTAAFSGRAMLLVLLVLGCLTVCALTAYTRPDRRARAVGGTGVFLAVGLISQFWVVVLTDGASDLVKHLVLTDLMTALLVVVTGASIRCLRHDRR